MNVIRCADAEDVARTAADAIAAALAGARSVRGEAHLCLSGGSTPKRCYELLGPKLEEWEDVHLWYGDERCVPPDHEDSNALLVAQSLVAPGAVEHRMLGELGPAEGAARYASEVADVIFDVCLNGLGPDGHTASLFPGHAQLDATEPAVGVTDSPKPPPERISLTFPVLNRSQHLLLLVAGADKAEALAHVLAGESRDWPASLLDRDKLDVIADQAALAQS